MFWYLLDLVTIFSENIMYDCVIHIFFFPLILGKNGGNYIISRKRMMMAPSGMMFVTSFMKICNQVHRLLGKTNADTLTEKLIIIYINLSL